MVQFNECVIPPVTRENLPKIYGRIGVNKAPDLDVCEKGKS